MTGISFLTNRPNRLLKCATLAPPALAIILGLGVPSSFAWAGKNEVSVEYGTTEYTSGSDTSMTGQHLYTSFKGAARTSLLNTSLFQIYSDIQGLVTVNEPQLTYFNPSEFYLVTPPREHSDVRFYLGEKKALWSRLDDQWQLGLWQPRHRWDYFSPQSNGLLGLFLAVEQPDFQILLWGSPIFYPEMNAPYDLKQGRFHSAHPFFNPPPSSVIVNGGSKQVKPIYYRLGNYSNSDIVMNPGGGVSLRVGPNTAKNDRTEGLWGRVSYAYKPINQILIGFEGYDWGEHVEVTLHPRVLYHHVGSFETGLRKNDVTAWFSINSENPIRDNTPAIWTTQELTPSLFAASGLRLDVAGRGESVVQLGLDYLRTWGGTHNEAGPFASDFGSFFESRMPYRDAASLSFRTPMPRFLGMGRSLTFNSKATREFSVDGMLLSAELRYHPDPHWSLGVAAELAGAGSPNASNRGADFLYRYRSNDQVSGGICYVF